MLFMERNELCWCGSGKKYKKCHMPIEEKILLHSERGEIVPTRDGKMAHGRGGLRAVENKPAHVADAA